MNDEYALRMASLLESERIFGFLRDEIPRLRDPSTSRRMDGYGLSPGRAQTT
jgi:hypothetical protein